MADSALALTSVRLRDDLALATYEHPAKQFVKFVIIAKKRRLLFKQAKQCASESRRERIDDRCQKIEITKFIFDQKSPGSLFCYGTTVKVRSFPSPPS